MADPAATVSSVYQQALSIIESVEPRIAEATRQELADQRASLKLIASENYASLPTLLTMGTVDPVRAQNALILVVTAEDTRWEVAQTAAQRLTQAGAKLIGSVFNRRRYYMPKWLYNNL